jgi:hypothetical protein
MNYPIFPSFSAEGKTPDDSRALESIDPTLYQYNVGVEQKGSHIMTVLVGIGHEKIHNVYRFNEGTWKFLFQRSL